MSAKDPFIYPDWPAPARVRCVATTRAGGDSAPPYQSLNLGDHVGDQPGRVAANRRRLCEALALPSEPVWLEQVHGTRVVEAADSARGLPADAACSAQPGQVCVVMTADCLPVLFCNRQGTRVAAAHAGWRGLADGVLEATLERLQGDPEEVLVWLGPAIGPKAFEVGEEVREAFVTRQASAAGAFVPRDGHPGKWLADLYQLARLRLQAQGVKAIYGGDCCTFSDPERFFSYRRDGVTGRQASLIWLD